MKEDDQGLFSEGRARGSWLSMRRGLESEVKAARARGDALPASLLAGLRHLADRYDSLNRALMARGERAKAWRPDSPTLVYLITHPRLGAHKVGLSKPGRGQRLAQHGWRGWEVYRTLALPRALAADVERLVLAQLRAAGHGPWLNAELMPQGGWTETLSADMPLPDVWRLVLAAAQVAA